MMRPGMFINLPQIVHLVWGRVWKVRENIHRHYFIYKALFLNSFSVDTGSHICEGCRKSPLSELQHLVQSSAWLTPSYLCWRNGKINAIAFNRPWELFWLTLFSISLSLKVHFSPPSVHPPPSQELRSKAASGVTSDVPFIEFVFTILPH